MMKRVRVSQNVHFQLKLMHRDHREAERQRSHPRSISKIIYSTCVFIGLCCLTGCMESEKEPSALEMTLESQAIQMAALNDRLARCEHQWQTNADELNRHNQVTMRDLNAFRTEQSGLRKSIYDMDARWSTQQAYLRNRQGQFQQGISDLNRAVRETDGRLATVNQTLHDQIDSTQQQLNHELDQLSANAVACNEQIDLLQTETRVIGNDVSEIQNQHRSLRTLLTADNQEIAGHLSTVAQNQEQIRETLGRTRSTAQSAVDKMQVVDGKQDQVMQWTQVHSQRVEKIDQGANARHAALTTEVKQMQQMAGTIQGQLASSHSQLSETAGIRFDQLEGQQGALASRVSHNGQKLDDLNRSIVVRHESLETQLLAVADTGRSVSTQVRQGDAALGQQLTDLDQDQEKLLVWAERRGEQQKRLQTRQAAQSSAIRQTLGTIQQQGTEIQDQLAGMSQNQTDLTQQVTSRFGGVTAHQAQVVLSMNRQNEKIDAVNETLSQGARDLEGEIQTSQDHVTQHMTEQGAATRQRIAEASLALEQKLDGQDARREGQHRSDQAQLEHLDAQQERLLAQGTQQRFDLAKVNTALTQQGNAVLAGQADLGQQTGAGIDQLKSQQAEIMAADLRQEQQLKQFQRATESQGQSMAERAAHLESLNQTLITQIHKVDAGQEQLQRDVSNAQTATAVTVRERSEDLHAQVIILSTILGRLEGRLEQTATHLTQSVDNGAQQDARGTRALQSELQRLQKTVGQISDLQQSLQEQLTRLQATVETKTPAAERSRTGQDGAIESAKEDASADDDTANQPD